MTGWEGRVSVAPGVALRVRIDAARAAAPAAAASGTADSAPRGPAGSTPVLLVNGLMMAIEAWQGLADALAGERPLVRYDQRGQGGSDDPPGPHTIEAHAADLVALVDHLRAHHGLGRVHLVGLSSGVPAAVFAAAELEAAHPGSVASLAASDGFVRQDAHLRLIVRAWLAAHEVGGPAHRFDVATPWVWGQAFLRDHADALEDWRAAAAATDPVRAHALIGGMAAFDGDAGPALATLRVPVLALHGEDDVMTPVRHGRALLIHASDGRLATVPEAGHAAPIERPAAVAALLRPFWAAADRAAPAATREEPR